MIIVCKERRYRKMKQSRVISFSICLYYAHPPFCRRLLFYVQKPYLQNISRFLKTYTTQESTAGDARRILHVIFPIALKPAPFFSKLRHTAAHFLTFKIRISFLADFREIAMQLSDIFRILFYHGARFGAKLHRINTKLHAIFLNCVL